MKKYYLIACEIMKDEINACLPLIRTNVDVKFMRGSLHEAGTLKMQQELQQEIDQTDPTQYDAILLCYGLCSNGIVNLSSPIPLVIPRAHDCIALLMGSKDQYQAYFDRNPGTFFQSPGWLDKEIDENSLQGDNVGLFGKKQEYIDQYGEDEGLYLYEMLGGWKSEYRQLTYINTIKENADAGIKKAKEIAAEHQWNYDEITGDTRLIFHLLNADWNVDEFLVIPPNKKVIPSYDKNIITHEP